MTPPDMAPHEPDPTDFSEPDRAGSERWRPGPTFDTRWLWTIVAIAPAVLAAGVYWLHRLPPGNPGRVGGSVVEVRLVREPTPAPAPAREAPRQETVQSEGHPEPLVEAPNRPIPEATTAAAPPPLPPTPANPSRDNGATVAVGRARAIPNGTAIAYQRTLLSHIARFKRAPENASGSLSGGVQVLFSLRRDGSVAEIWVRTSSGHPALDRAATETILRAQPLPPIPPDLPDRLTIVLPVSFDPT